MPNPNPVYLQALDGSTWVPGVSNAGILISTQLTPPPGVSAQPWYELNDAVTGETFRLVVLPCPAIPIVPPSNVGELHADKVVPSIPGIPTQLLVTAPNGVIYFIQIASGFIQTGFATPASASCSTSISALASNVQDRLEEPHGPGVFWLLQYEIYTALVEAMNETMMLVGRPTQAVQLQLNLVPNTVWQSMPKGIFSLTDIFGPQGPLRQLSLFSMDYEQASWGSDWECDTSDSPKRWCPVGLNMFAVHPAANTPVQAIVNAVAYPVAVPYPYTGVELIPFEHHFHVMLEMYAAVYLRLKEGGADLQSAMPMLEEFYAIAKRMTHIQDRRDSLIFSNSFGVPSGVNAIVRR